MTRRNFIDASLSVAALSLCGGQTASPSQSSPGTSNLQLDPIHVPLSRFGSYLAISNRFWTFGLAQGVESGAYYVRCLQDDANPSEVFRIDLLRHGQTIQTNAEMTIGRLRFSSSDGASAECCLPAKDSIRIRGDKCQLRLQTVLGAYGNAVQIDPDRWLVIPDAARSPVQLRRISGEMRSDVIEKDSAHKFECERARFTFGSDDSGPFECELLFYEGVPRHVGSDQSFDQSVTDVALEFEHWASKIPELPPEFEPQRKLAAYVLWSSTVAPRGLYTTPVVWGSKNWMSRIWSWDHCFASLGLSYFYPDLAWQQFMIFRDMQDPVSGMLADSMSSIKRSWVCTKNPVHGWALGHLLQTMPEAITSVRLMEAYEPLRRWTMFWLTSRDYSGDGLPCIIHPNESFDNTTANAMNGPVRPPETATYLALQLDTLAKVADRLGFAADAREWRLRSAKLVQALVTVLWDASSERFVSRSVPEGHVNPGDCVFSYMPLLLGDRLPAAQRFALIKGLTAPGRFLTGYGLSTEALTSPLYNSDSYVKGPSWAPINTLLAEALDGVSQRSTARRIRRGFLAGCLRGGMSEHFDAKTGTPQGDPCYIWTAAMYLWLAKLV